MGCGSSQPVNKPQQKPHVVQVIQPQQHQQQMYVQQQNPQQQQVYVQQAQQQAYMQQQQQQHHQVQVVQGNVAQVQVVGGLQYQVQYQQQYQWQMQPSLNKELLMEQSNQAFDTYDQDQSGNLNLTEFYAAVCALFAYQNHPAPQKQLVDHLLQEYDYINKVKVNKKDFRCIIKDIIGMIDDEYKQMNQKINMNKNNVAQTIFCKYDQDRSGFLSEKEFFGAVCEVFQQMQLQMPSEKVVQDLLEKHDSKGKGKIREDVFAVIMKSIYERDAAGEKKSHKEKKNKEDGGKKKKKKH